MSRRIPCLQLVDVCWFRVATTAAMFEVIAAVSGRSEEEIERDPAVRRAKLGR